MGIDKLECFASGYKGNLCEGGNRTCISPVCAIPARIILSPLKHRAGKMFKLLDSTKEKAQQ